MSKHMNAEEQIAVIMEHYTPMIFGTDAEYREAAMAIGSTATSHVTGFALCYALGRGLVGIAQKITELGQVPVTAHEPTDRADQRRITMAARFAQAAGHPEGGDDKPAYDLFCQIEEQAEHDEQAMAALIFFMIDSNRQMAQQLKQALIDQEATA